MKPETRYTKSENINIAYQVYGSGAIDLVYIPGWVSNIDLMWQCPELVSFFVSLSGQARIILFDKRGTGLSDRIVEFSSLEERMDDIRAVMDAAGSSRAVLFGHSEGGSAAALFAATYPERVVSLIMFGAFAKRQCSEEYPWAPRDEERQKVYEMIKSRWGSGEMDLESLAPSMATDKRFMSWLARYFISGASSAAALLLTKMNTQVDIIDILPSIRVPTLILQRTYDIDVRIEEGRFLAENIKDSRFVELDGHDHLFWVGNTDALLQEIETFLSEERSFVIPERQLLTILVMRLTQKDQENIGDIYQMVERYHGTIVTADSILTVTFKGPSSAVYCSLQLRNIASEQASTNGIGMHILELESNFMNSENREYVNSIINTLEPAQITVTQSVRYLLSGTGLTFTKLTREFQCKGGDMLTIFTVSDQSEVEDKLLAPDMRRTNKEFLERLVLHIEAHMDQELTVENLCEITHVSARQLQRKLKMITNKSPVQFISSVRLHKAKKMLLIGGLGISEVAFKAGFSSPSYFSKKFKEEFGISPSNIILEGGTKRLKY